VIPAVSRLLLSRFCASLVVLLAPLAAFSSTNSAWFTRSWQTDDGLPNNQVTAVAQGSDGCLWVGTPAGLMRFDGVRFTSASYRTSDQDEDQGVHAIVPSQAGGLWIVPNRGPLAGLTPASTRVELPTEGLPKTQPSGVLEDAGGALWIAYYGAICRIKDGRITQLTTNAGVPARGTIYGFTRDSAGNIWLAKGGRVGILHDGQFQPFAGVSSRLLHLTAARTNGAWIASGTHLVKCDDTGKVQDFGNFQPDTPHAESWVLMEDHTGAVWIGTDGSGLFRRGESGFERIETSHPYILSLAEDREGNIWVGTSGGGLDRISPSGIQLEGMRSDSSLVAIQSVCEDTNGVLWGATQNGLLVSRQNGQWSAALVNQPPLGVVTCVAADRSGAVWIGTRDIKLHCWRNGALTTWDASKGFASHTVVALLPASSGDLWVAEYGTPNTLQCLHDGQLRTVKLPGNVGRISALAEDTAARIWAGSERGVLMRALGDQFVDQSASPAFPRHYILCLYPSADGALWIGYAGAGLARYQDGRFARIGTAQGLSDNRISQIISDGREWFWFGSGRGIFKIRQPELEDVMNGSPTALRPIRYGRNEGLFSMEANAANVAPFVSPSALRSQDGRLWIPMRTAIAVVNPALSQETCKPPAVLLTRVALDGRPIASCDGTDFTRGVANLRTLDAPLQLPPGHRRLELEFTALNFSAPDAIRFRYRLEGFDGDWVDSEARSVAYSRLPAGDYHFRVQASVGDGAWSEAAVPLGIVVSPFFWQTWSFRLAVLAIFTCAIIATVRYVSFRRLRRKLHQLEHQTSLEKERTRIARDLHDDLGGSLTQVALLLDMTHREATLSPGKLNGKVQQCSSMVRQVAKSVDEIIWAINPRNDTLRYVIDYISQFVVEYLHAAGIRARVDLPDRLPDRTVSPEARHELFLGVKEALSNVARHAQATEVSFQVVVTDRDISITLTDNGRGFTAAPDNASADGVRNMSQRMQEIGGAFELRSAPGDGTRVSFCYPLRSVD
jgi:signal transduction histidine kinase/ligand-binding sensor domain-containing protein